MPVLMVGVSVAPAAAEASRDVEKAASPGSAFAVQALADMVAAVLAVVAVAEVALGARARAARFPVVSHFETAGLAEDFAA